MNSETTDKFARVSQRIDRQSRLVRAWTLDGGVSAQVTALEIERGDGKRQKLIVRQHGAADLSENESIAADEFKLLARLRETGLPVPAPYLVDASGEIFETPYLVVEYVEGATEFAPSNLHDYLRQMALTLARIHTLSGVTHDLAFLPREAERAARQVQERPARLDESLSEGQIRDALMAIGWREARNPVVLLHGDYWAGNLLWSSGQLVGIIDWEDAKLGEPLADLADARLETLWTFGNEAMQEFTEQYQLLAGFDASDLPYRDLIAALKPAFKLAEWGGDTHKEADMREKHRRFVEQALAKLTDSTRSG